MSRQSLKVTVFEWGRGPGGRTARRRIEIKSEDAAGESATEEVSFDHAAPYFSARTRDFRDDLLAQWQTRGLASRWKTTATEEEVEELWVGQPSNHAIARGLVSDIEASGGEMYFGRHVTSAIFDEQDKAWRVQATNRADKSEESLTFDALVLSDKLLLLPNTYAVIKPEDLGEELAKVPSDLGSRGAVVLLVAFAKAPPPQKSASFLQPVRRFAPGEHPLIEKIVHDSEKPGRQKGEYDLWVVHSTAEYASSHLVGERLDDEEAVREEMTDAFLEAMGIGGGEAAEVTEAKECGGAAPERRLLAHASVMAWDHSQPEESKRLTEPYLLEERRFVGACGDYFQKGRAEGVEAAALSGLSLAEALGKVLLAGDKS